MSVCFYLKSFWVLHRMKPVSSALHSYVWLLQSSEVTRRRVRVDLNSHARESKGQPWYLPEQNGHLGKRCPENECIFSVAVPDICEYSIAYSDIRMKMIIRPKMTFLSSLPFPRVVPDLYDCMFAENKNMYFICKWMVTEDVEPHKNIMIKVGLS